MQAVKRVVCITFMFAMLLSMTACGGPKKEVKKYDWGGYQFTVKKVEIFLFINLEILLICVQVLIL